MASLIDPTKPIHGTPTTQSVRDNFTAAKSEIEALQDTVTTLQTTVEDLEMAAAATIGVSQVTLTVATGTYNLNNVIGTVITFPNAARTDAGAGLIQSVSVSLAAINIGLSMLDLILFRENPTASTFTDKAALAMNAADALKVIGVAHITDFNLFAPPVVGQALAMAMPFKLPAGTSLYGVLVSRFNGILNIAGANDVTVTIRLMQN